MHTISWPRLILGVIAAALGAFFVAYGGNDDSPGAQLIGVIGAGAGIACAIKSRRKIS
ncbi:MAG TPA: hypothetical protein VF439_01840 [Candidatus Paceibacterota bacterium]